jgi:uncharacterized protein YkwD
MHSRVPIWLAAAAVLIDLLLSTHVARADALDDALAAQCANESRLGETAGLLLRDHDPIDREALRRDAERHGVFAPSVRAWVARGGVDALASSAAAWLANQNAPAAWARCAIARDGDLAAMVFVPRVASVAGTFTSAALEEHRAFQVTLPAGARSPTCVLEAPDGSVSRCRLDDVHFEMPGAYAIQVLAETSRGPMPFATWHVYAGNGIVAVRENADNVAQPTNAFQVLAAINRVRVRAGRETVRVDPMLTELARSRAATLAARGEVAHGLRRDDSPVTRLANAGISADRVAENVARARSVAEASARLDASPSHRANRIDETVDAVGIGIATVGEDVYLVELYAARPRIAAAPLHGGTEAERN